MAKARHLVRVWADRGDGERTVELVDESIKAHQVGMGRVTQLQADHRVVRIGMQEHVVVPQADLRLSHRGTLEWLRQGHHWRQLPDVTHH